MHFAGMFDHAPVSALELFHGDGRDRYLQLVYTGR
jgi:hypothetical protein